MKLVRNISILLLSAIFLVSATGIVIFYTHCACSGNNQVSVYISPETCEENFHVHHKHNEGGEEVCTTAIDCHECSAFHADKCGCSTPDVKFLKLDNQAVSEKVRMEKIQPLQQKVLDEITLFLFYFENDQKKSGFNYIDPPPQFQTSTDFLICIHQLKISGLA